MNGGNPEDDARVSELLERALNASAASVTGDRLRPDGEARLRGAIGSSQPHRGRASLRWVPAAVAAAVLVVVAGVGTVGFLRDVGSAGPQAPSAGPDATRPSPGVGDASATPDQDDREGRAARVLAASGVRQCADVPITTGAPPRARIVAAYQCTWGEQREVVGEGTFEIASARKVTGGLERVLDLADRAVALPTPSPTEGQACLTIAYAPRYLWLTLDDGRVVRWQVPWTPSQCGGPSSAEQDAWQSLVVAEEATARGDKVGSSLALYSGCPDEIKNALALASPDDPPTTAGPARPAWAGSPEVCFYRADESGSAVLEAAASLDGTQAQKLAEQVASAEPAGSCPVGGQIRVAWLARLTVPGHPDGVFVDLDGCSLRAGYEGGWWRAPQALRDELLRARGAARTQEGPR